MVLGYHVTQAARHIDLMKNGEAMFAADMAPFVATFIDVGANVGDWTAYMLAQAPAGVQGLAIDPSQSASAHLKTRFAGEPAVDVACVAVTAPGAPAEVTFFEEPDAGQTASLVPGTAAASARSVMVPTTTVAQIVARRGWAGLDLLKIDTEGYDLHVLRGCQALLAEQRIGAIQFEYNSQWRPARSSLLTAYQLLEEHGYMVYMLSPAGLQPFPIDEVGDFFSYANFVALSPAFAKHVAHRISGEFAAWRQ
jgi:FkbM family methyltransferase